MMNKQPGAMPMEGGETATEEVAEGGKTVTVTKAPDGSLAVNGEPCKSVDECMQKVYSLLEGGGEGGMSVEEAFGSGFDQTLQGAGQFRGGYGS